MKKTLFILLFLATYIFANEIANNDLLELNYEDSKRIYSYLEKFKNKKLEEELKKGLNVNATLSNLKNPRSLVKIATGFDNKEATKLLLKYGANPSSVLGHYISRDDLEIVEYLLEKGAIIRNSKGYDESSCKPTFASPSIFWLNSKEMLEFLVSKGADISQKMANGETILDYLYDNLELRKYIMDNYNLDKEYFICIPDIEGSTKIRVKHFYNKTQMFHSDGSIYYVRKVKNKETKK